jgi:hypothetical protein
VVGAARAASCRMRSQLNLGVRAHPTRSWEHLDCPLRVMRHVSPWAAARVAPCAAALVGCHPRPVPARAPRDEASVRAPQPSGGVTEAVRASLRTDARAYVARHAGGVGNEAEYRFTVIATFTNTGPHAISLARCLPTDAVPIHAVWHADHTTGGPADEGTRAANLPAYSPALGLPRRQPALRRRARRHGAWTRCGCAARGAGTRRVVVRAVPSRAACGCSTRSTHARISRTVRRYRRASRRPRSR